MRRPTKITAALAGTALAATTLIATHAGAADSRAEFTTTNGVLRLCEFSDNQALTQVRLYAEGPQSIVTGALPNNGQTCVDTEVPPGQYWVHPEKYAAAPCDNVPASSQPKEWFPGTNAICQAKLHHVHITHSTTPLGGSFVVAPYGSPVSTAVTLSAEPTIDTNDGDEWSPAFVTANQLTKLSYHDTDVRRPECAPAAPNADRPKGIVCNR